MSKHNRMAGSARTLSTTVVPVLVTVGLAAGGAAGAIGGLSAFATPAFAANSCNPCAAKNPCNPCNPCGAANPCNPCNPCAGGAATSSSKCDVPRLAAAKANPCAAKDPCNPCNPCGAAKGACNPCNPCAAKNPCNPCAAKNPCNPCGAANPCNPCGAAQAVELKPEEAIAAYECLRPEMLAAYAKSGHPTAKAYSGWPSFNTRPYVSGTHGGRHVNNYANETGKAYGGFEKAGKMPVGTMLAKDSFIALPDGKLSVGPLFMMEKMKAGFNASSGDWRYTLIGPNGAVIGETGGKGAKGVVFCAECHAGVGDEQDHMMFMPDEFRKKPN